MLKNSLNQFLIIEILKRVLERMGRTIRGQKPINNRFL